MLNFAPELLLVPLAAMLVAAMVGDVRARIIPNWLNGAIALTAPLSWAASGLGWPAVAAQIAMALLLFGLFALAFRFGMMGGGDVKLIAALALWLAPAAMLQLLLLMSLGGGALTVAMMIRQRLADRPERLTVPYGVAIAGAGLWLISERILYQFG